MFFILHDVRIINILTWVGLLVTGVVVIVKSVRLKQDNSGKPKFSEIAIFWWGGALFLLTRKKWKSNLMFTRTKRLFIVHHHFKVKLNLFGILGRYCSYYED